MPYKDKRKIAEAMRRYRVRKKQRILDFHSELAKVDKQVASQFQNLFIIDHRGRPSKRRQRKK